jgi:amino acid adenylation domain-containing protein
MSRIDERVGAQLSASPDRPAVIGSDETLSAPALEALANRFARAFLQAGVQPGDRVGIHLPRSPRGVAAMLGAMRAGGAYVPLDPGSPPPRVGLIARDCGLRHVVISPPLLAQWTAAGITGPKHCFLSQPVAAPPALAGARIHPWEEVAALDPSRPPPVLRQVDDLAYVLYTSGSTGTPKGVMLSHRNALAFTDWTAGWIGLSAADRVASVAPFHFDLSVFDLWASLSHGATVVIVDEGTVVSGRAMVDRIHAQSISVWYSVPSALMLMLEKGALEERGAPSLRTVLFAGEVFPLRHLRRSMAALPRAGFYNLFGPTETNVCTAYRVPGPPPEEANAIPIGTAACGDRALVVDLAGKPVADGEVGELFIEGPTVMLGYWDGGRRTPAPHPYPTGDLVSRRPDGQLMYHGRRDHMLKIHGFRVEPAEVEAALVAHPSVREAVVFAADQQLVAVVVRADAELSVMDLRRHCAARLPRYMIPGGIRIVQDLPRTSSGKIDRLRTRDSVTRAEPSPVRTGDGLGAP